MVWASTNNMAPTRIKARAQVERLSLGVPRDDIDSTG